MSKIEILKKNLNMLLFVFVLFGVFVFFFLELSIYYKIIIFFFFSIFVSSSTSVLTIDKQSIRQEYFLSIFNKNFEIRWEEISEINVVYRSGLTHGAMMPSYIQFFSSNYVLKEIYYTLSKKELQDLEQIVKSKEIKFRCINNPYRDYS